MIKSIYNIITHKINILLSSCFIVPFLSCALAMSFSISALKYFLQKYQSKANKIITTMLLLFIKVGFVNNIRLSYNPEILSSKKSILVSNHVNKLDWLVIWISLTRLKKNNFYFSAKKELLLQGTFLKRLNSENMDFIFLERDLNYDYISITEKCNKMASDKEFTSIIFPEGTLITHSRSEFINSKRSKTRNCRVFQNVMMPKTKGFKILHDELQKKLTGVIDCTLQYSNKVNLWNFLKGKKVDINIYLDYKKLPKKECPEQWLINIFDEKDVAITNNKLLTPNLLTINVKCKKYMLKLMMEKLFFSFRT